MNKYLFLFGLQLSVLIPCHGMNRRTSLDGAPKPPTTPIAGHTERRLAMPGKSSPIILSHKTNNPSHSDDRTTKVPSWVVVGAGAMFATFMRKTL